MIFLFLFIVWIDLDGETATASANAETAGKYFPIILEIIFYFSFPVDNVISSVTTLHSNS